MKDFFAWAACNNTANKDWLILGKGPSFGELPRYDISSYATLSLNHAVREQSVDIAHIIDLDVVESCSDALLNNACIVVMPWHPHIDNKASASTLGDLCNRIPVLERLRKQERLLWYNLSTAENQYSNSPIVQVANFSFEAALNLLAMSGVRKVRSLGIDGGQQLQLEFQGPRGQDPTR